MNHKIYMKAHVQDEKGLYNKGHFEMAVNTPQETNF